MKHSFQSLVVLSALAVLISCEKKNEPEVVRPKKVKEKIAYVPNNTLLHSLLEVYTYDGSDSLIKVEQSVKLNDGQTIPEGYNTFTYQSALQERLSYVYDRVTNGFLHSSKQNYHYTNNLLDTINVYNYINGNYELIAKWEIDYVNGREVKRRHYSVHTSPKELLQTIETTYQNGKVQEERYYNENNQLVFRYEYFYTGNKLTHIDEFHMGTGTIKKRKRTFEYDGSLVIKERFQTEVPFANDVDSVIYRY